MKNNERTRKNIIIEKRASVSPIITISITLISIVMALIFVSVFLFAKGYHPVEIYQMMFTRAFISKYGLTETVIKAIPLMLAGLGISIAFRMLLWNIGAEGQIYMGAFAASGIALAFPDLPRIVLLPAMLLAGFVMGGLWALVAAIPRALWKVNETITTLMLNYIAILWVSYLVFGPWKDPQGFNFPLTREFSEGAAYPLLFGTRVHFGIIIALLVALVLYVVLNYTRWGYEIRVIGESESAARYAGMNVMRNILLVMFLSGGLAGMAGMGEVAGVAHRLQAGVSPGYGYTAIIVAWLGKLNPWVIVLIAFLFGGLTVGASAVQSVGLPAATSVMIQGAILFFVLGADIFMRYRISFNRKREEG